VSRIQEKRRRCSLWGEGEDLFISWKGLGTKRKKEIRKSLTRKKDYLAGANSRDHIPLGCLAQERGKSNLTKRGKGVP